jgi:hypothetical protein
MIRRRTESNDILLELVAKTLAVGAYEMQVEYEDRKEHVLAFQEGVGFGIASLDASSEEARALREALKAFEELGKKSGEEIGESLADGVAKTLKESLEKEPKGQEAEVEVALIKASETSQSLSTEQIEFLAIIAQTSVESALLEFDLPSRRARRIAEKVREIAMERFIAFRSAQGKA